MAINVCALLDDDIHPRLPGKSRLDVVADPALGRHIGDVALHGLRVKARRIPQMCIRDSIAVLIAIAIPVFASQLERAREATDLANVRSAYAQVSAKALLENPNATVTVDLKQKQADWQSLDPVNIGGIVHYKNQGDTDNWKGVAAPNGTCVVSYNEDCGIILTWSGKADPSAPKYPFNTSVTDFFPLLCLSLIHI